MWIIDIPVDVPRKYYVPPYDNNKRSGTKSAPSLEIHLIAHGISKNTCKKLQIFNFPDLEPALEDFHAQLPPIYNPHIIVFNQIHSAEGLDLCFVFFIEDFLADLVYEGWAGLGSYNCP